MVTEYVSTVEANATVKYDISEAVKNRGDNTYNKTDKPRWENNGRGNKRRNNVCTENKAEKEEEDELQNTHYSLPE